MRAFVQSKQLLSSIQKANKTANQTKVWLNFQYFDRASAMANFK